MPYDSPISNSGLLFYNTLFDENAACHLALGRGFTNTVKGYEAMSDEQLKEKGVNDSAVHVEKTESAFRYSRTETGLSRIKTIK